MAMSANRAFMVRHLLYSKRSEGASYRTSDSDLDLLQLMQEHSTGTGTVSRLERALNVLSIVRGWARKGLGRGAKQQSHTVTG